MSGQKKDTLRRMEANAFDHAENYIALICGAVFTITGLVSAYASFSGFNLFAEEVGGLTTLSKGVSVIMTIAVASIMIVGWSLITRFGPEARGRAMESCMVLLGTALLVITLAISSLSNLMALVGPASKIHDWRNTHSAQTVVVEQLASNALGVKKLLPSWRAEAAKACPAATQEVNGGTVSGTGLGAGPVVFALNGVCEQTRAFAKAMEDAISETDAAVSDARVALLQMRAATRDRKTPVIEREDRFLLAGDVLTIAMQDLRAADLTLVLEAGAQQVRSSVAELSSNSAFTAKQVETVRTIRVGIEGLIASTEIITEQLRANTMPERQAITSPDYIEGVVKHAKRFVPVFAAAIGIDLFQLWALFFMLVSKAGQPKPAQSLPFWALVTRSDASEPQFTSEEM
ncbi:hypothetical protein [uncultured Tateyamaria sp.]|uniref:hypothetical protein n=1 Tax=uncultured Tateyamaria sp. TaxID=455651 RepID=UPI00260C06BD|nr:hypothetical protein [uncultured Tateyamaria sp.]